MEGEIKKESNSIEVQTSEVEIYQKGTRLASQLKEDASLEPKSAQSVGIETRGLDI